MDPVPIVNRKHSCNEILSIANKLATIFKNAAGLYSDLASTFTKLHVLCTAFADSVDAIQLWLISGSEKQLLDSAPWYQLSSRLVRAEKVITALQDEVQSILRSRYESRSRSRTSDDWDLEGLQSHEEDLRHETESLGQSLVYMQLLETVGMGSRTQVESRETAEGSNSPRDFLHMNASNTGNSQADTEVTTDRPAPPYNLVDVRTRETHTKWHPDQSVVAADDAMLRLPSIEIDAAEHHIEDARSSSISVGDMAFDLSERKLSDGHWPTSSIGASTTKKIFLFIHDQVYNASSFIKDHPGGEQILLDIAGEDATEAFEDVGHSHEAREMLAGLLVGQAAKVALTNSESSKLPLYQFRADHREIGYGETWPWQAPGLEFLIEVEKSPSSKTTKNLNHIISKLFPLLTKIWPFFSHVGRDSVITQIFVQIDTVWKLSLSIGATLRTLGPHFVKEMLHANKLITGVRNLVDNLAKFAYRSDLSLTETDFGEAHWGGRDPRPYLGSAKVFAETVNKAFGFDLTESVQRLAGLNVWLQLRLGGSEPRRSQEHPEQIIEPSRDQLESPLRPSGGTETWTPRSRYLE